MTTTAATANTTSSTEKKVSCPYAAALLSPGGDDDTSHNSMGEKTLSSTSLSSMQEFSSLQEKCPAFQNKSGEKNSSASCPFKSAKNANDVKQTLLQLPPSHLKETGQFFKIIQHLHQAIPTTDNAASSDDATAETADTASSPRNSFTLPGGCPMREYYIKEAGDKAKEINAETITISFTRAMEDCSLSAIMARMAKDMAMSSSSAMDEHEEEQKEHSEEFEAKEEKKSEAEEEEKKVEEQAKGKESHQASSKIKLAEALKDGTAVAHQKAEDVDFINDFVRGKIDRKVYPDFVLGLYYIYDTLEQCLEKHANHRFPKCHSPRELNRKPSLVEDLEFWFPLVVAGDSLPAPSPATRDYMDRLEDISKTNPLLLLSHAYTRYLGDLSGGKILQRVARKALGLTKDVVTNQTEGLAFYEFPDIPKPKQFKDNYRASLNELNLTDEQIQLLVQEANIAFLLNIRVFQELSSSYPKIIMPLEEALGIMTQEHGETKHDNDNANKCPFQFTNDNSRSNNNNNQKHAQQVETKKKKSGGGVCPWPFILLHDFRTGMQDVKSWIALGLLLSLLWSQYMKQQS